MTTRTGILRGKQGLRFDEATGLAFKQQYDIQWQSVVNGAARLSGRRRGVDQATYWIGLDVPAGRKLVLWGDTIKLTEGDYDVDVFDAPDGFTGGSPGIKRCLCGATGTVQTQLYFGVIPADTGTHVQRLESFIDVGATPGAVRPALSPVSDDAFQILYSPVLIRITRVTGTAYVAGYWAVAWETDADD